ncbi:metal ABC transporter ATP-binding protein [Patescibacteria group bacterium]
MSLLEVKNLSVKYDNQIIIEGITFALHEGDFAMIIGPNGSGKTTLLKGLLGLVPRTSGDIVINGHTGHLGCREVGYVPQRFNFDHTFPISVNEFINLATWYKSKKTKISVEMIHKVLALVDLADKANTRLGVLSGGQLQRVLIARALIHQPKLLVMDEPAAGIDVMGETNFYQLIKKLQSDVKLTVLMVSHDIDTVFKYANQVLCLNKKLMCFGQPDNVLSHDMFHELYGQDVVLYRHGEKKHL